ncbi:MAG: LytTR family transcriptional regulator [Runella slithyformis]|nr:MAG: LytTR family transcriptional regulator [Runella slithyformis]
MIQVPASYYNYNHQLPFSWQDVLRLEGSRNYTIFVLFDGSQHISTKSLGNYEAFLPSGFLRVHKGHAVNLSAVVAVHKPSKTVELSDGFCCKVARRRWKNPMLM